MIEIYPFPSGYKPSPDYKIFVNGSPVFCGGFAAGAHAAFGLDEPVDVRIVPTGSQSGVRTGAPLVRPLSLGLEAVVEGDGALVLRVDAPAHLYLETGCGPDLMLFANPLDREKPAPDAPGVRFFRAGRVHDGGDMVLQSGETIYIEGGAVVKGRIRAHGAQDVTVAGHGILDGRHYTKGSTKLMVFDGCSNVHVSGITSIGTPSWNLVLGGCTGARVDGVKLVGWVVTSDGVDVVGSQDVLVSGCFIRSNDDCVAVKALDQRATNTATALSTQNHVQYDWCRDVSNVRVRDCVFYNDKAGNAMEVGFETRTGSISGITFSNIDVIGAHGEGAVFSIHNGDRAHISGVIWEDIRVEHFYDKLIDFRVLLSRYSQDSERGTISDVTLRRISCVADPFNTVSLIAGATADSPVRGVRLEQVVIGGQTVTDDDALNLFRRHAEPVQYSP